MEESAAGTSFLFDSCCYYIYIDLLKHNHTNKKGSHKNQNVSRSEERQTRRAREHEHKRGEDSRMRASD